MKRESVYKGILGLGAVSTAFYLKEIHHKYQKRNGEFSTASFVMYQIDFQEINPFLPNNFEVLIPKAKSYLKEISDLGITRLLVPNITLHETLDQIEIPFEICHPVDLTLEYLEENRISEAYLFGTLYTMNSEYLNSKFSERNIKILKPTDSDQSWIDTFRKKVYLEKQTSKEIEIFQNLIQKYSGKKPVVIACTELSIYSLKQNPSCIDMMDLQIEDFLK